MEKSSMISSYHTIRKIIGTLGILLPCFVLAGHKGVLLTSISHYYYTESAVFFIAILSSFGFFLISYKGYDKDAKEMLSDNAITHIGGFAVLLVVLFPTACIGSECDFIANNFSNGFPLFGHTNNFVNAIHFMSAGIFLFSMGWMSIHRFTKSHDSKYHTFYKITGYTVWVCVAVLAIEFSIGKIFKKPFYATNYDVFILETIAVISFGSSWLIKGKVIRDIAEFKSKVLLKFKKGV